MQTTFAAFGKRSLRALTKQKAIIAILIMLIVMLFFKTKFYTSYNLLNVLKDAAVNEIIAFGVTLTVIAAGCDLSVGGVMCLSGIVSIQLIELVSTNVMLFLVNVVEHVVLNLLLLMYLFRLKFHYHLF